MIRNTIVALAICSAASLQAATLFSTDFETGSAPAEISGAGSVIGSGSFPAGVGLGNFVYQNAAVGDPAASTDITLTGIGTHTTTDISFTFLAIDSWDGTTGGCCQPDVLNLYVDGNNIFQASFRNFAVTGQLDASSAAGGVVFNISPVIADGNDYIGSGFNDSVWSISLSNIAHTSSTMVVSFFASGSGWQGGTDESIGLDNINVSADVADAPTPEPATALLLIPALAGLAAIRRRAIRP